MNKAISKRIADDLGEPLLTRIASSAITAATGQEAANAIMVQGAGGAAQGSMHDARTAFDQATQFHLQKLEAEIDVVFEIYRERADRAHATFTDRATHALIEHLEKWGEQCHWEYDPAGTAHAAALRLFGDVQQIAICGFSPL